MSEIKPVFLRLKEVITRVGHQQDTRSTIASNAGVFTAPGHVGRALCPVARRRYRALGGGPALCSPNLNRLGRGCLTGLLLPMGQVKNPRSRFDESDLGQFPKKIC